MDGVVGNPYRLTSWLSLGLLGRGCEVARNIDACNVEGPFLGVP